MNSKFGPTRVEQIIMVLIVAESWNPDFEDVHKMRLDLALALRTVEMR